MIPHFLRIKLKRNFDMLIRLAGTLTIPLASRIEDHYVIENNSAASGAALIAGTLLLA
jgi:hypothetical protein